VAKKKKKEEPTPDTIEDFKGIVRAPRLITKNGRVLLDLGVIDSPSLATGIAIAVNKTALEVKQLKSLTEWAVQLQHVFTEYAEKMKICDCPICQAKAYVDSQLGKGTAEAPAPVAGIGGHYL